MTRGDGLAWVLTELHSRIDEFMHAPQNVTRYVRWAVAPYFSNSDEQTLMNDVIASAVANVSMYAWSTALFEAKYGGSRKLGVWESSAEKRQTVEVKAAVHAAKRLLPAGAAANSTARRPQVYPLRPLGAAGDDRISWFARAPLPPPQLGHNNSAGTTTTGSRARPPRSSVCTQASSPAGRTALACRAIVSSMRVRR